MNILVYDSDKEFHEQPETDDEFTQSIEVTFYIYAFPIRLFNDRLRLFRKKLSLRFPEAKCICTYLHRRNKDEIRAEYTYKIPDIGKMSATNVYDVLSNILDAFKYPKHRYLNTSLEIHYY